MTRRKELMSEKKQKETKSVKTTKTQKTQKTAAKKETKTAKSSKQTKKPVKQVKQEKPKKERKPKAPKNKLKIIPLGGLLEIGKNMTAFEYGNDLIIVDVGMAFGGESPFQAEVYFINLQSNNHKYYTS